MTDEARYSIKNVCERLDKKIIDFINSEYLGKNDELRAACSKELHKEGTLYQAPYLEVSQSYATEENGIEGIANIPQNCKDYLLEMSELGLGVFRNPYRHQVDSLKAFFDSKDIFVSTGTGSGKTECFMWPLCGKLFNEALNGSTWDTPGVRALMLYPMNALVSDQISRLRCMIGTDEFRKLFHQTGATRVPRFGMYTGRTLNPGERKSKDDRMYAETVRKELIDRDPAIIEKLKENGKYPAKRDLEDFLDKLEEGGNVYDDDDSEMLLRFEMQEHCPDILITNYSMLELMLLRPIEDGIWSDTKKWLDEDERNKILFIIDEAHMYRGSSGGEVSLLVRRVMNRLGVGCDRFQFILTSASVPFDKKPDVLKFANDLTSQDSEDHEFEIIRGTLTELDHGHAVSIDPEKIADVDIDAFQNEDRVIDAVRDFSIKAFGDCPDFDPSDMEKVSFWLYDMMSKTEPVLRIQERCRGKATKFSELPAYVFPDCSSDIAEKALETILAITPLARNREGQVLLPSKLHLFFKGLTGVYACINPDCTEKTDGIDGLGKIYLNPQSNRCKCGGKIYELMAERTCGSVFIKGYMDEDASNEEFLWDSSGIDPEKSLVETHLMMGESDNNKYMNVWVNIRTGKIERSDMKPGERYVRMFYRPYQDKDASKINTFHTCPICGRNNSMITDFRTKGNNPFFNIVTEQLKIQPPQLFAEEDVKKTPNQGRKVLLFSDSRQNAAKLAKDMSELSINECIRAAVTLSWVNIQKWAEENDAYCNLNYIYPELLRAIGRYNLKLFSDDVQNIVEDTIHKRKKVLENKKYGYKDLNELIGPAPDEVRARISDVICNRYRSLSSLGICWVEPRSLELETLMEVVPDDKREDVRDLSVSFLQRCLSTTYALDMMDGNAQIYIDSPVPHFGLEAVKFSEEYGDRLRSHGFSDEEIQDIDESIADMFSLKEDGRYYLNSSMLQLKFESGHKWYKCKKCKGIMPFALFNKCSLCMDGDVEELTDFDEVALYREPVRSALEGDANALKPINVEEHTAQLSHKDQRDALHSTTEDYELRFKNIYLENSKPVDILSCTTTMEVGIDIGSLTAVGMRNVPPSRENYQQRSGRAGRRGSSVSTIVTYADKGRYDRHYFNNPDEMVSGDPRVPWIDVVNEKLITRHLLISVISEFLRSQGEGTNPEYLPVTDFFNEDYTEFKEYMEKVVADIGAGIHTSIVPRHLFDSMDIDRIEGHIIENLDLLKKEVSEQKDKFEGLSILDVFQDRGLIPTYSFPRNIVGFGIYKSAGANKYEYVQKPERQLELALSEYAPGKKVIIDKKEHISGAICYLNERTKRPGQFSSYMNERTCRIISICEHCGWFGLGEIEVCPFCGDETDHKSMLTPCGFAPLESGCSKKELRLKLRNDYSYASSPCYSTMPQSDVNMKILFKRVRYENRYNQKLLVINRGQSNQGFTICRNCGAAVMGNESKFSSVRPYHPFKGQKCRHDDLISDLILGHDFLTDLVVYEVTLEPSLIDSDMKSTWLKQAALSLSEALCQCAGRLLDVESDDLCNGFRLIRRNGRCVVELYMYDSLSSGAGYSTEIANKSEQLFSETEKFLAACTCEAACYDCLKNYKNRFVHDSLDRHAALDLLRWGMYEALPDALPRGEQLMLLEPLADIVYELPKDDIVVYPSAWSARHPELNDRSKIHISKLEIERMLPNAYMKIIDR